MGCNSCNKKAQNHIIPISKITNQIQNTNQIVGVLDGLPISAYTRAFILVNFKTLNIVLVSNHINKIFKYSVTELTNSHSLKYITCFKCLGDVVEKYNKRKDKNYEIFKYNLDITDKDGIDKNVKIETRPIKFNNELHILIYFEI